MIERKQLNRLVVATLRKDNSGLKAIQIYNLIRKDNSSLLRQEHVKSFRSFVKVINQFQKVKQIGSGVKLYSITK